MHWTPEYCGSVLRAPGSDGRSLLYNPWPLSLSHPLIIVFGDLGGYCIDSLVLWLRNTRETKRSTGENTRDRQRERERDLVFRLHYLSVAVLSLFTPVSVFLLPLILYLCFPHPSLYCSLSPLAHLSQGQRIKERPSRPLQFKDAILAEARWIHKHRQTHSTRRRCVPPLALPPRRREAKWWSFGAECSVGLFHMLSELLLGLTYAYSSQHPDAVTSAGGPIKLTLPLQWNDLNCHSHAGIFPTGGARGQKVAHINHAYKCYMCKHSHTISVTTQMFFY